MTPYTPKSELKRRSYGPDKFDKENCRDKIFCRTGQTLSRQRKLCRDRKNCVATENLCRYKKKLCRDKNTKKKPKMAENGYFGLFSSPFHPRIINTRFLGFRAMGRWENTSHGVSLSKLPIFLSFLHILIFNIS